MQATHAAWLHLVPGVMICLFFVASLLYAIVKRSDQSSARVFAILGISILIVRQVFSVLFPIVFAPRFDSEDFMLYFGLFSIVSTLFYILALSLIMIAVFVGRGSSAADQVSSDEQIPVASSNPYTPPVNG